MWPVRRRLDWKCRIDVAIGFTEGLMYLHHDVMRHIIYEDMKAGNMFLDSDFARSLLTSASPRSCLLANCLVLVLGIAVPPPA
jgi:hypothetical protein